jgi:alkaline phosphatase
MNDWHFKGRFVKYRKLSIIALLVLGLCPISSCAAEQFDYKMAQSDGSLTESFYLPAPSDATLKNISGSQVRNVILCIGDGMGFNHIALARHNSVGPEKKLHMERLPVTGIMRTFSADDLITDSAAGGTAMACGIKTNNGMIGVDPDKIRYSSILILLQQQGWRTGLVATSQISHATPAAFASHVDSREKQKEIAVQLFENRVDVLLGGGRKYWSDDILTEAVTDGYQVIRTRDEMATLKDGPVIGLFAGDGMTTAEPEPSIVEMAKTAIDLLSAPSREWFAPKPKFFLMIEGSQIDWASHANNTDDMIRQLLLFDMAVQEAIAFAENDRHTLLIVTADHETGGLMLETERLNKQKIDDDWEETGHTAVDVPVFAFGPGSERFSGVMDNTELPKRIAELTGIAPFPVIQQEAHPTEQAAIK